MITDIFGKNLDFCQDPPQGRNTKVAPVLAAVEGELSADEAG